MTKRWEDHRAIIVSLYKEQHKPLHEVQRLMVAQYGFNASVRAYRSRFDKWGVHKYNCRRRGSNGSQSQDGNSPRSDDGSPEEQQGSQPSAATPPSDPHSERTTPLAAAQAVMSPSQPYFPQFSGGGRGVQGGRGTSTLVPLSPGSITDSTSSSSNMSRNSSISQPPPQNNNSTSPTDHQYNSNAFDVYRYEQQHQHQPHFQGSSSTQQYYPHRHQLAQHPAGLVLPQGMETQHHWPASPSLQQARNQVSDPRVKGQQRK